MQEADYQKYIEGLKAEFPSLKLVDVSWLPGVAMTLGRKIFVNPSFHRMSLKMKYVVLRHERIHLIQQRDFGLIYFLFCYALVLPTFLSVFRYRWERAAYTEALRAWKELGMTKTEALVEARRYASSISGRLYLFSWPRSWSLRDMERAVEEIWV